MTEEKKENRIIVITGPTAVGKTGTAVRLAKLLGTEIISADSMQVYRGMDIGTAKVTGEEMDGVPHHLIDICDPMEEYDVTWFQKSARKAAAEIQEKGMIPIVCGGTGFYIQALLYDIDFKEEEEGLPIRDALFRFAEENGKEALFDQLREVDPVSCERIPPENIKRVVRAIEFYRIHGEPISLHNEEQTKKREKSIYDSRLFVLYDERKALYERINQRVDRMMEEGLLEEAGRLLSSGVKKGCTSLQAIGYHELLPYFEEGAPLSQCVEQIKIDSRHYAKKQLTWFKREKDAIWINAGKGDTVSEIRKYLW